MTNNLKFISPRVISLAEETQGSDIYVSIKLVLLDTLVNLNGIQYSKEFLQDVADNKDKYLCIPLMAEVSKLESGKYDNLTHAYNSKTGKFKSQMIGSFIDFYIQESPDDSTVIELVGECRVPKRFEKTTAALQELYDEGKLQFSYEIACGEYTSVDGVKYVDKSDKNFLFAMAVVSNPAVVSAKALTLCAAIEEDFNLQEGEMVTKERNKDITCEEMFANTKVHITELAELDMNQIRRKIYQALKVMFKDDDYWNWDIIDQFPNYIIVQDYRDGDYYKIDFTVSESDVTLSEKKKVTKTYQEIQEDVEMATVKEQELEQKVSELETQIASLNTTISEKDIALQNKEKELAEKSTQVETLSASVLEKDNQLKELEPIKAEHEKMLAEKQELEVAEKRTALKEKYSKLLSEETLSKVEIAEAIEKLDETVLKDAVIEIAMSKASENKSAVEVASRITDNVSIGKSDLISRYITVAE